MKGLVMRLSVIFLFVSILTFLSLVSIGAIDEGTQGDGIFRSIILVFSKLFYLFRFPTHTFLFDYMDGSNFIWGLLINCLFWTMMTNLILTIIRNNRNSSR